LPDKLEDAVGWVLFTKVTSQIFKEQNQRKNAGQKSRRDELQEKE
jgi:hypothetical protein